MLALAYRRALRAAWREPVLRAPVLILESDDWGYGPAEQAERLEYLAELLAGFRDQTGRHPVMTLGVVLAGPDTALMRAEDCRRYHRVSLDDPRLEPVRNAMLNGVARGVFALQLHGREHYWPECLMHAAQTNAGVRDWLTAPGFPATEALPPPLQSRWIDAADLPSRPLPADRIAAEATAEIRNFTDLLGVAPEVAVPPTFVWTTEVESAWSRAGIRVVVTPGRRNESRDRTGGLVHTDNVHYNGARGPDGLLYVVRDSYFEPSLGHTHQQAMDAFLSKSRLGRPALIEIHRMNFIDNQRSADHACDELSRLLATACARFGNLRFMNTAELAAHCRRPSDLVETRAKPRVHFALRRLAEIPRLRKLALLTGAAVPAWFVYLMTSPRSPVEIK